MDNEENTSIMKSAHGKAEEKVVLSLYGDDKAIPPTPEPYRKTVTLLRKRGKTPLQFLIRPFFL